MTHSPGIDVASSQGGREANSVIPTGPSQSPAGSIQPPMASANEVHTSAQQPASVMGHIPRWKSSQTRVCGNSCLQVQKANLVFHCAQGCHSVQSSDWEHFLPLWAVWLWMSEICSFWIAPRGKPRVYTQSKADSSLAVCLLFPIFVLRLIFPAQTPGWGIGILVLEVSRTMI